MKILFFLFFMGTGYSIIIIYFLLVNIVAFVVWGVDKWKAENNKWRTSEKTLLRLTVAGGFVGALIGMTVFHHKTIKGRFLRWFMLIAFAWLLALVAGLYFLWI